MCVFKTHTKSKQLRCKETSSVLLRVLLTAVVIASISSAASITNQSASVTKFSCHLLWLNSYLLKEH